MGIILIVEDQPENQSLYADIVYRVQRELGLTIQLRSASDFENAQRVLKRGLEETEEAPLLILLDMEIPYKGRKDKRAGYRLMQQYREHFASSYWVPLTANIAWHEKDLTGETPLFDDLYKLQPFDVFSKGSANELKDIVRRALRLHIERTGTSSQEDATSLSEAIIGFGSDLYAMADYKLYREIRSAAENSRGVLLFGEPGTGKTLTARLMHYYSDRRDANFRVVDSTIDASELEQMLFPSSKQGDDDSLLGQAQGGTLYIADFDRMGKQDNEESQRLQRKLLHYRKYRNYDVRIIGGINRSRKDFPIFSRLLPEILDTMILQDLLPLRERKDDIPLLIDVFLEQFNQQRKKQSEKKKFIDLQQFHEILQAQDWRRGNIAQLRMVIEEVLFKAPSTSVTVEDLKSVWDAYIERPVLEKEEATTSEKKQVKDYKSPFIRTYEYDVALSCAKEDDSYADKLAEALHHFEVSVFYDKYKKPTIWGEDLQTYLSDLFQNKANYCVMFLSKHYAKKSATERAAAQARAIKEPGVYILPIRLDDTEIPGILQTTFSLNWHEETPDSVANIISNKLRNASPMPLPNNSKPLSSTMPPINTSNPSQKKEGQKYFLGQQPDETLKMVIRKHPLFLVSPVLPLLGSIALLFLMLWFAPSLPLFHVIWLILEVGAGFLILFTAAYFVYKVFILWRYEANILTDKRIINWSSSFLNPSREESSIANIRQVAIDQESFLGVLLNYGTVHVYITRGELVMKNVPNPTSVRNAILSAREILIQIRYQGEHSSSTLYAKQDDKGRGSGEIK